MSKFRKFMITCNNYTEDDWHCAIGTMVDDRPKKGQVLYAILCREVGEECGTPHFHLWLHYKGQMSLQGMRDHFWRHDVQPGKGNDEQARLYLTKDDDYLEWGEPSKQGERTDLEVVREMIDDGMGMREICDKATSYQSLRSAELLLKYKETKRDWLPEVYWFWGPSGTGKTRTAYELENGEAWMSGESGKWFDGYDAHEAVIFDDFRGDFCKFNTLLRLLDRYPYRIECKGSSRQLLAKRMYITCPKKPQDMYPNCGEQMEQLLRRIKEVRFFGGSNDLDQKSGVIICPDWKKCELECESENGSSSDLE